MPTSPIDEATVKHLARLARIRLDPKERATVTRQLSGIVEYIEQLEHVDVQGVAPLESLSSNVGGLRADIEQQSLERDDVLTQARNHDGSAFVLPPFVDED